MPRVNCLHCKNKIGDCCWYKKYCVNCKGIIMLFYAAKYIESRYVESSAVSDENIVHTDQTFRKPDGEYSYLEMVKLVLNNGQTRIDRTKTGTLSLFSPPPLVFNLETDGFPLLTTKRVGFKTVFYELMWFIKGQTDGTVLLDNGVIGPFN